jgi:hypothetical protein
MNYKVTRRRKGGHYVSKIPSSILRKFLEKSYMGIFYFILFLVKVIVIEFLSYALSDPFICVRTHGICTNLILVITLSDKNYYEFHLLYEVIGIL